MNIEYLQTCFAHIPEKQFASEKFLFSMNINYFSKLCHWFAPTTIKSKLPRLICLNNNGGERLPLPLFQKSKYTNVHLYTNRM